MFLDRFWLSSCQDIAFYLIANIQYCIALLMLIL
jgi:hypothetical protein